MARFKNWLGALALGASLALAAVIPVSAADYTSQITAAGADLVTDVTPAIAAGIVIALGVMALFIAARLALKAFRLIRG